MVQNEVLKRGLLALELVKYQQVITLKEVMNELNLSKSTAFRLLTTLEGNTPSTKKSSVT